MSGAALEDTAQSQLGNRARATETRTVGDGDERLEAEQPVGHVNNRSSAEGVGECGGGGAPDQRAAAEVSPGIIYIPTADTGQEVKALEESIEEMLTRTDEFCGMLDMARNDTSEILDEHIPTILAKAAEMKKVYDKIDKLEAFVKIAERHASFLEDQLIQAEKEHGIFPRTIRRLLHSLSVPSFLNIHSPAKQQEYELPKLYRTEDYFPVNHRGTRCKST